MLNLHCGQTAVQVDPGRGLTIRSLRLNGREVMADVPWEPGPVRPQASPAEWVQAWQGGWQPALPNAGLPGSGQGYHGAASQAPWEIVARSDRELTAGWTDDSLRVTRVVTVLADGVIVHSAARNTGPEPRRMVVTEHLVLGTRDASIEAPGTVVHPLDDAAAQLPGEPWPGRADPDWSVAVAGRTPARCAAVAGAGPDGVVVRMEGGPVRIRWDRAALPYFWLWQSIAAQDAPPWNGETAALGVEPSTTPHGQGIDAAGDQCLVIEPGESVTWWVSLTA
ncbi:MAG TPA: DUF4432 family protein [Mycobacteriales bacterium]|nr:DUF4432 family protein [Mycobacteriales bacterium]